MRHRTQGRKFGRVEGPRKAMLRALATSLMLDEKITTTSARAKEIRPLVEHLLSRARENTLTARRELSEYLYTERAVLKVLNNLAPRYKARTGGYTRITKMLTRKGDGAEMSRIELL